MLSATPFGEVDLARIDLARVAAIAALANVPDPTPTLPHGLSSAQHTLAAAHHAHECAVAAGFGAALAREPDLTAREWARRHEGGKVMP